jgi:LacI family gluconate utilization system Gnt-I transcriptional repressor
MTKTTTRSSRSTGRATLADVARLAGVSQMTASRALRGESRVDAEMAQRVQQASEKLGYVPDPAARALASQRSSHIAVMIPSLTNTLFVDLLEAAQSVLRAAGYQTLVGVTHYDPQEEEQLVREQLLHRPAGLLLTGLQQTARTQALVQASGIPVVYMMENSDAADVVSVGFSQSDAASQMTRHLLDCGYRRIAFAAAQLDARTLQRLHGWRKTMQEAGLHDANLEWLDPAPSSIGVGGQLLAQILASKHAVQAVFFCNDDLAQGALLAAQRSGLQVPGQVAIAGFNDLPASAYMVPSLSTVKTPRAEVGHQSAQLLLQLVKKEEVAQRRVDLGFSLVPRESTQTVGNG